MSIRFKCPHCKKPLVVKDHLAGKRAACPVCKKPMPIPVPTAAPADVESLAAAAFGDVPVQGDGAAGNGAAGNGATGNGATGNGATGNGAVGAEAPAAKSIKFNCYFCDEPQEVSADLAGKRAPCTECKRINKVPVLEVVKPKDWRETLKKGPTAALVNLPEQLEGAWGTELKTRVSGSALIEADALPEAELEPIGVAGWLKRGLWTTLIVGGLVLAYVGINTMRHTRQVKDDLQDVNQLLDAYMNGTGQLSPMSAGILYRGKGEVSFYKGKAKEAKDTFSTAQAVLSRGQEDSAGYQRDLCLQDLALAQAELGGTDAESLSKERVLLEDMQPDLRRTLDAMTPEGKSVALRAVASRLAEKNKLEYAISLAGNAPAETVAYLLGKGEKEKAAKVLPPPEENQPIKDFRVRVGYAEGWARAGDYSKALQIVKAPGPASDRVHAGIAAAAVALADRKEQSAPFKAAELVREAFAALEEMNEANDWLTLQVVTLTAQTEAAPQVEKLIKTLPSSSQGWAQLAWFKGTLTRSGKEAKRDDLEKVGDADHPARSLAWEFLARHNARLGYSGAVRDMTDVPENQRPFMHLGLAIGAVETK